MSSLSNGQARITQAEYEQGVYERVRPQNVQDSLNCIFRWLISPPNQSPYAVEMFGQIVRSRDPDNEVSEKRIYFQRDGFESVFNILMNPDGFIVKPFSDPDCDLGQPKTLPELGYLMDVDLSDGNLAMIISKTTEMSSKT